MDLKTEVIKMVEQMEKVPEPDISNMNAYNSGVMKGGHDTLKQIAKQLRALVDSTDTGTKSLTPGCEVLVIKGIYKDQKGVYHGVFPGLLGLRAEVVLDGQELPIDLDQDEIQAI